MPKGPPRTTVVLGVSETRRAGQTTTRQTIFSPSVRCITALKREPLAPGHLRSIQCNSKGSRPPEIVTRTILTVPDPRR